MSVLKYFKNIPRSPSHRATGPKCNFFLQICNEVPREKKGPVARWGATGLFFQGPHCKFEKKKLHLRPVALWGGDRGVFLKYFKTDIYF